MEEKPGTPGTSDPSTDESKTETPETGNTPTDEGKTETPEHEEEFVDISNHWAKDAIMDLVKMGLVSGYPDNTIRPDNTITRAEAIVVIVKALGYKESKNINIKFGDMASIPDWAKGYIQTAVDLGIIHGYEDNTIRPNNKITRAEMVVVLVNAFKLSRVGNVEISFTDSQAIPDWAMECVEKAYSNGIIKGYEDKSFMPGKNITRAEAFTMIRKCLMLNNN